MMASRAGKLSTLSALLTASGGVTGLWSILAYLPRQACRIIQRSLHVKFIVVIVALQVVTMGIVTVVMERHQRQAILEQARLRALALARSLAVQSESYLLSYNFFKLEQVAEHVEAGDPDVVYAAIHLHDGAVAVFSGRDELQGRQLSDPISQQALQATTPLVQHVMLAEAGEPGYDVALPVFVKHSPRKWGTIRLGFSLQQAYERIVQTRRDLYVLSLGAIVCGTCLASVLAKRVTRPIRHLVEGAQAFARGAYDHPVRVDTHDELAYLARTFEQMMQAIMRDLTERQRLEAHLQQAQKMEALGTLAGGIAHDFNNVLAVMMGYTQLVLYELPPDSSTRQSLQEVLTAGNRAKEMVQQILLFSRKHEQERQPLHLHLITQEIVRFLRVSLPSTIEIRLHLNKHAGMVMADPTQLHQVLMNLCVNAEYAMRDTGGVLEIRIDAAAADDAAVSLNPALQQGPYICLSVRDTGCGMPPEVAGKIFDPFFTTKPAGEGTGMGLAVVHGIVTRHGGAIAVESELGEGTTFTIYLPRVGEVVKADPPMSEPMAHRTGCLLWVDDETVLAHLRQALLQRHGYDVVAHTHSDAALHTFGADPNRFDLVITDQTTLHMTGEKMVRELRRIRPDIPIILYAGFSHTMSAERAQALGINAFLMKPTPTRDWVATIEQVLERCGRRHRDKLTSL